MVSSFSPTEIPQQDLMRVECQAGLLRSLNRSAEVMRRPVISLLASSEVGYVPKRWGATPDCSCYFLGLMLGRVALIWLNRKVCQ